MLEPGRILLLATGILTVKIALIFVYGAAVIEGEDPDNLQILATAHMLSALTILAILPLVLVIVAFLKNRRGWKLYVSIPISLLAFGVMPFVYVV